MSLKYGADLCRSRLVPFYLRHKNGAETDRAKNIHLKSHNAENCKGDSLGLSKIQFVSKYQKLEGGPFGEIRKFSEKRLTKPKKNRKGDLSVSSGFANARQSFSLKRTRTSDRWLTDYQKVVHTV